MADAVRRSGAAGETRADRSRAREIVGRQVPLLEEFFPSPRAQCTELIPLIARISLRESAAREEPARRGGGSLRSSTSKFRREDRELTVRSEQYP